MFPSVTQLRSRCAEGGWVSKHTAQQIGKEEHQQSTAAMHLTDCSDNRQGKHSHRERKKNPKKDGGRVQRKRREMRSERQKEKRGEEGQRRERKPQTDKKGGWEERREKKQIYFFLLMFYFWSICSNNTESCHARNKASEIWGVIRREHQRKGGELLARRQGCGCGTIMETPVQSLLSGTALQQTLHLRNLRV